MKTIGSLASIASDTTIIICIVGLCELIGSNSCPTSSHWSFVVNNRISCFHLVGTPCAHTHKITKRGNGTRQAQRNRGREAKGGEKHHVMASRNWGQEGEREFSSNSQAPQTEGKQTRPDGQGKSGSAWERKKDRPHHYLSNGTYSDKARKRDHNVHRGRSYSTRGKHATISHHHPFREVCARGARKRDQHICHSRSCSPRGERTSISHDCQTPL